MFLFGLDKLGRQKRLYKTACDKRKTRYVLSRDEEFICVILAACYSTLQVTWTARRLVLSTVTSVDFMWHCHSAGTQTQVFGPTRLFEVSFEGLYIELSPFPRWSGGGEINQRVWRWGRKS